MVRLASLLGSLRISSGVRSSTPGHPGRDDGVSRGLESGNPVFPAERSHPEAMNEDNSWF